MCHVTFDIPFLAHLDASKGPWAVQIRRHNTKEMLEHMLRVCTAFGLRVIICFRTSTVHHTHMQAYIMTSTIKSITHRQTDTHASMRAHTHTHTHTHKHGLTRHRKPHTLTYVLRGGGIRFGMYRPCDWAAATSRACRADRVGRLTA